MEDSFKLRVDKIFGTLNSSSSSFSSSSAPPSSSLDSLWCLTDDEIERREWNRDKRSPEPESCSQASFLVNRRDETVYNSNRDCRSEPEKDLEDLDEDNEINDDEELQVWRSPRRSGKPEDYNDEEWEVKSSIGLDCTLDNEEEEDEYDKVAVGNEKPEDRVYMRDMEDYGIDIDSELELPTSFKELIRDPRANHLAAKIRLKEDAEAAKKIDYLRVSDEDTALSTKNSETIPGEGSFNPKSILKRKDNQVDAKSHKRVRFDPECKDNGDTEPEHKAMKENSSGEGVGAENHASGIPDYLRNPSRYTHYTFDSSSAMDEESNKQAYMDLLKVLNKSNASSNLPPEDEDARFDRSRSVTFIPRKKGGDTSAMVDSCTELVQQVGIGKDIGVRRGRPIGIAATEAEESDACAMEEDEPETTEHRKGSSHKPGRQYRLKARSDLEE